MSSDTEKNVEVWNNAAPEFLHKVSLQINQWGGYGTSIELDGIKVKGLRDVELYAPLGEAPVVTISFIPGKLRLVAIGEDDNGIDEKWLQEKVHQYINDEMRKR